MSKDARALLSEIEDSAHRMHPTTLEATLVWLRRTTSALPSPTAARGRLPPYAHSPPPDDRYAPNRDTSIPPWVRAILAEVQFCHFMALEGSSTVLMAEWLRAWHERHPRSPGLSGL